MQKKLCSENTPAYFAAASAVKKVFFSSTGSCQCYETFFFVTHNATKKVSEWLWHDILSQTNICE